MVIKGEGEAEAARLVSDAVGKSGIGSSRYSVLTPLERLLRCSPSRAMSRTFTNQNGGHGDVLLDLQ